MPAELTKGEVEELEALLEKATQGPLEVRENHPHGRQIWSLHEDHGAEPVASYLYDVDAQLFAKAINALPALLTLARSAPSAEELALREAAVKMASAAKEWRIDDFGTAQDEVLNAARTYARSVEERG